MANLKLTSRDIKIYEAVTNYYPKIIHYYLTGDRDSFRTYVRALAYYLEDSDLWD